MKDKTEQNVTSVKVSKLLSQMKEVPHPYTYSCGNYMDSVLTNELVRKTLQLFADKHCKEDVNMIRSSSQKVCNNNYPRLFNIIHSCCKSLSVDEVPEVYITDRLKGINALSVGTDDAPMILISRKAVVTLTEGELKFMLGHELGHILQKNLICHTIKGLLDNLNEKHDLLGPVVLDLIEVPLNQWYRSSEFTADRAGYLCCLDMKPIINLFNRIVELKPCGEYSSYLELYRNYPFIQSRVDKICEFAQNRNMSNDKSI